MFFSAQVVQGLLPEHLAFFILRKVSATGLIGLQHQSISYLASIAGSCRFSSPTPLLALGNATSLPSRGGVSQRRRIWRRPRRIVYSRRLGGFVPRAVHRFRGRGSGGN